MFCVLQQIKRFMVRLEQRCSISHKIFQFIIFVQIKKSNIANKVTTKKKCQKNSSIIFKARLSRQIFVIYSKYLYYHHTHNDTQQMFIFPKKSLRKLVCLHPPHTSLLFSPLIFFSIFFLSLFLLLYPHQKQAIVTRHFKPKCNL